MVLDPVSATNCLAVTVRGLGWTMRRRGTGHEKQPGAWTGTLPAPMEQTNRGNMPVKCQLRPSAITRPRRPPLPNGMPAFYLGGDVPPARSHPNKIPDFYLGGRSGPWLNQREVRSSTRPNAQTSQPNKIPEFYLAGDVPAAPPQPNNRADRRCRRAPGTNERWTAEVLASGSQNVRKRRGLQSFGLAKPKS